MKTINSIIIATLITFSLLLIFNFHYSILFATSEPTSVAYISAGSVLADNGWYKSAVTVTIEGTSPDVASLTYWLNGNNPAIAIGSLTTQSFPQNGQNTLYYYATDSNGIRELATNELHFKIDTTASRNWRLFKADQNGNDHTFDFYINVEDTASGLDSAQAQVQYSTNGGLNYGYNTPTTTCNNFTPDSWITLTGQSFASGDDNGQLSTPTIDMCNSNWSVCKFIRFKIKDMAGNESERTICLFGAWMQATTGNVYSKGYIDITSSGTESVIFPPQLATQ